MSSAERIDLPLIPVEIKATQLPPEMFEQALAIADAADPGERQALAWHYAASEDSEEQREESNPVRIDTLGGIDPRPEQRERTSRYLVVRAIIAHNKGLYETSDLIEKGLFHPGITELTGEKEEEGFEEYMVAMRMKLNSFALLPRSAQQERAYIIERAFERSRQFVTAHSATLLLTGATPQAEAA